MTYKILGTPSNERNPKDPPVEQRDIRALRKEIQEIQRQADHLAQQQSHIEAILGRLENRLLILETKCDG